MIEAELKARLNDPDAVRHALARRTPGEAETYLDTYFDTVDGVLDRAGREIRIRTITSDAGARHVLTYKGPAVDQQSDSKPEHETAVENPDAVRQLFGALGYEPVLVFTKNCENYRFSENDRDFLATVVQVPEIEGTFLEVETMTDDDDAPAGLEAVRSVMARLGVHAGQLTKDKYTDAVRAVRLR